MHLLELVVSTKCEKTYDKIAASIGAFRISNLLQIMQKGLSKINDHRWRHIINQPWSMGVGRIFSRGRPQV